MSTSPNALNRSPLHRELLSMTLRACTVAQTAVTRAAESLARPSSSAFREIADCELELDRLDQAVDERIAFAVAQAPLGEAREVLACLKFMTDLERIGDLVCAFGCHAQTMRSGAEMADVNDLIKMATVLEKMIGEARQGICTRDLDKAVGVVRADAEIDRLRNLVFVRNLSEQAGNTGAATIGVLFMTQCLERAGDHAVNLGEEICHLITGHSIRHMRRQMDRSYEQKYLRWLREHSKIRARG